MRQWIEMNTISPVCSAVLSRLSPFVPLAVAAWGWVRFFCRVSGRCSTPLKSMGSAAAASNMWAELVEDLEARSAAAAANFASALKQASSDRERRRKGGREGGRRHKSENSGVEFEAQARHHYHHLSFFSTATTLNTSSRAIPRLRVPGTAEPRPTFLLFHSRPWLGKA